jgi:peptidyl-prolyl cis-trans isomerase D
MLRTMRESMKYLQWTLWLVVAVFVLFIFFDFGGFGPGSTGAVSRNAASVGDMGISMQDFEREYRGLEDRMRQQLGANYDPEVFGSRIPAQALDRLVTQRILAAEAASLGISVTDEELREAIRAIPGLTDEDGRFIGKEAYSRALRNMGYTPESFEQALREDLLVQRLNDAMRRGVFIPTAEIERNDRERSERVALRFVELPWSEVGQVQVDDAETAAYFASHREEFRLPERRVVDFLVVEQGKLLETITPTDAELQAYYEAHREDYTQEEQVQARHILINTNATRDAAAADALATELKGRIAAGEDFAALATQYSDDVSNRDRGGDLGSFGRGRMVKAFEDAAFAANPGEVVGPVRTQFGVHLIQVLDKREQRVRPLEEVKTQVLRRVQTETAAAKALERAQALREQITKDKLTTREQLVALAQGDTTITVDTTQPFGRDDAIPGLGRAPELLQAAFDLAVDGFSAAVAVPRGAVILRLAEIQDPRLPELDEVRGRVVAAARTNKQRETGVARLAEARERLAGGTATLDDIAGEMGLTVRETGEFGAGTMVPSIGNAPALVTAALALETGDVGQPYAADRGALLYTVINRTHWDATSFAERADSIRQGLEFQEVQRLMASLIAERKRVLGVTYDRQLLEQFDILDEEQQPGA